MREIDKVLDREEKVLWEDAPKFWPFFFGRSLPITIFGIVWTSFMAVFIINSLTAPGPFPYVVFAMPHLWIGLFMLFGPTIYNALVFKHTYYAITDKRIIIQKGWIGRDFEMVDFDQVTNAEVNVSVFDKIFGGGNTGSILISTAGSFTDARRGAVQKPYTISNVPNPYDVFKFFKKVAHDVKTDIQYPNKLRPGKNPGYQTDYDPDKK
jgi:membrane protein YdbS with pleckstrin-like domain